MSQTEIMRESPVLPTLPDVPEESWRRTDPELFFLAPGDVCGADGKSLLQDGVPRKVACEILMEEQTALQLFAKRSGSVASTLRAWLSESEHASRTVCVWLDGGVAHVLAPPQLRGWIRLSVTGAVKPPVFPGSVIGQALSTRLQEACGGSLQVDVPSNAPVRDPILIIASPGTAAQELVNVSVNVAPHAKFGLGILGSDAAWAHRRHDIMVGENSCVDLAWLHMPSMSGAQVLEERRVLLSARAELRDVFVGSTQGMVRSVSSIVFVGEGARAESGAALAALGKSKFDYEPLQEHRVGRTYSSLRAKILADDEARAEFQGLIIVAPQAQHTTALQNNKNLLLGSKAKIDASPRLEIYPDDVVCKHGSATGEVDSRQLYYLMTRGFSESEARALIVDSFLADGLAPLGSESPLASLSELVLRGASKV